MELISEPISMLGQVLVADEDAGDTEMVRKVEALHSQHTFSLRQEPGQAIERSTLCR